MKPKRTRTLLLAVALSTGLIAAAACSGGGSASNNVTPTPSPSGTTTTTPTPPPSPVPTGPATVRVMVSCTNAGCVTGRLRTYLFDCTSGVAAVMRTDFNVSLTAGAPFPADLHVVAPIAGCVQATIDDSLGGTGTASTAPQVTAAVGDTQNAAVLIDNYAL